MCSVSLLVCVLVWLPLMSCSRVCTVRDRSTLGNAVDSLCQLRPTVVNVQQETLLWNRTVEVVPDFVSVQRCGGVCNIGQPQHKCVATSSVQKSISLMQVEDEKCIEVTVTEHVGCECSCREITCVAPSQVFDASRCDCVCTNTEDWRNCVRNGRSWDQRNCRCLCPTGNTQCSTGYVFDWLNTCTCVLTASTTTSSLVATLALAMCSAISIIGGYVLYKRRPRVLYV